MDHRSLPRKADDDELTGIVTAMPCPLGTASHWLTSSSFPGHTHLLSGNFLPVNSRFIQLILPSFAFADPGLCDAMRFWSDRGETDRRESLIICKVCLATSVAH